MLKRFMKAISDMLKSTVYLKSIATNSSLVIHMEMVYAVIMVKVIGKSHTTVSDK